MENKIMKIKDLPKKQQMQVKQAQENLDRINKIIEPYTTKHEFKPSENKWYKASSLTPVHY